MQKERVSSYYEVLCTLDEMKPHEKIQLQGILARGLRNYMFRALFLDGLLLVICGIVITLCNRAMLIWYIYALVVKILCLVLSICRPIDVYAIGGGTPELILKNLNNHRLLFIWYLVGLGDLYLLRWILILRLWMGIIFWGAHPICALLQILLNVLLIVEFYYTRFMVYKRGVIGNIIKNYPYNIKLIVHV